MLEFDLAVIGSGPGGYVAAIAAAQAGLKTCVFEKEQLGGVCLNSGCIPTKTLISSVAKLYALKQAADFGIDVNGAAINFPKMMQRKAMVMHSLRKGIQTLFNSRNITLIKEQGIISGPNTVSGVKAKNIIIATGSSPMELKQLLFDHKYILSSTDLLNIDKVPESLIIIGGGVIGAEFAWIFSQLGAKVTIIEMMPQILPTEDREIAKKMEQIFTRQGISVHTKTVMEKTAVVDGKVNVETADKKVFSAEKLLLCVGRSANIQGFGLDQAGVAMQNNKIKVDEQMRTNINNVYAIGDVVGKMALAHVASYEGQVAIKNIQGEACGADYSAVPSCIFTHPEIAGVGLTEAAARARGREVLTGKFPFQASGKAQAMGETEGFVKIIVEKNSDVVLGAQILGAEASNLIAEITPFVANKLKLSLMAEAIHAHPTLSEAVQEAGQSIHKKAIHLI